MNTLPAGTFGGADAIRVRRNARGIVTALEFDYDRARNVDAIIKEYESDLGPPEVTIDSTGAGQRRFSTWRNSTTEFRIIEFTPPVANSVVATAILSDK